MVKILKSNCEQMALLESLLRTNQDMYLVGRGDNVKYWKVQEGFEPIVVVREYELKARDLWPIRLKFESNTLQNVARLKTDRRGIDTLKRLMPDVFSGVNEDDDEEDIEIKSNKSVQESKQDQA